MAFWFINGMGQTKKATMSLREIISFLSKARCIGRAGLYILENLRGGTKN